MVCSLRLSSNLTQPRFICSGHGGSELPSCQGRASDRGSEPQLEPPERLLGKLSACLGEKNEGEPTTTETRDRWLLPLFQELGFGTLAPVRSIEIEGKSYPVSHGWGPVPIHLVGSHVDIDRRTPGAVGASRISPHSLVQQLLNASDDHLWGIVSNGMNLRLLRDNAALTRLAYVEWDLQAIFDADVYPEFLLLWLVCHQSRFEGISLRYAFLNSGRRLPRKRGSGR